MNKFNYEQSQDKKYTIGNIIIAAKRKLNIFDLKFTMKIIMQQILHNVNKGNE